MSIPTRDLLNHQADRIERVLAAHRVAAKVHGGAVVSRWTRFFVQPEASARIATIRNLSEELAMALGVQDVRVARDGEVLAVEVAREEVEPVRLLALLEGLGQLPALTACLGLDANGRPLLLRLASPETTHVLVAGTTGSGKTELLRTLAVSLALNNRQCRLQLALIDPKGRGLGPLRGLPHVLGDVASDGQTTLSLLARLNAEMERRDADGLSEPHVVIVIDELLDVLALDDWEEAVEGPGVAEMLTRMARRGREAGLHLVAGVQRPSAAAIGPMLRANFPVRLVGRVGSADDARVASGLGSSGAERLAGRGDFLAVAAGRNIHFQAAWIPARDWAEITGI